jgi:hypothetical protein
VRLTKRDVEAMLARYDDAPIEALTVALRKLLDQQNATWGQLIAGGPFSDERRQRLLGADEAALDTLLGQLNELRTLHHRRDGYGS